MLILQVISLMIFLMGKLHAQRTACAVQRIFLNSIPRIISSPNYPRNYPDNLDCTWILTAPAGYIVTITFIHLRTEPQYDFLYITSPGQSRFTYDGYRSVPLTISRTGTTTIRLTTDGSVTRTGFQARVYANDINECTSGTAICGSNFICVNTPGSYSCSCRVGYTRIGGTCIDKNECATGEHNCGSNSRCTNTIGSYFCRCRRGFTGNSRSCRDVDECSIGTDNCGSHSLCTNTFGSFICLCDKGFTGDGIICNDLNECVSGTHTCSSASRCNNTYGSHTCSCYDNRPGGPITCSEISVDTMMNNIENISKLLTSSVRDWYNYVYDVESTNSIPDGGNDMFDVGNIVEFGTNAENLIRSSYNRTYSYNGYQFSTRSFHPFTALAWIEESETGFKLKVSGNAGADHSGLTSITNRRSLVVGQFNVTYSVFQIYGTRDPTICKVFLYVESSEIWNSVSSSRYTFTSESQNTDMINTHVSVTGRMKRVLLGYMLLSKRRIGENSAVIANDDVETLLRLVVGTLESLNVTDYDECARNLHDCSLRANCTNTHGSYICSCNPGFSGDGRTCRDVHECSSKQHECDANSWCTNLIGSYTCTCRNGFNGTGRNCEDIDECREGLHDCYSQLTCINTPGSYTCSCYNSQPGGPIPCQDVSVVNMMNNINNISAVLIKPVNNWYNYRYDGRNLYSISDGGFDMFDAGNIVTFGKSSAKSFTRSNYNQTYLRNGYQFLSQSIYPFTALAWIESSTDGFKIKVSGNTGADGNGNLSRPRKRSFMIGQFNVTYSALQIFGTRDPTICHLFFYIQSPMIWNSVAAQRYQIRNQGRTTEVVDTSAAITGRVQRVLLGYMLLSSRTSGQTSKLISNQEIIEVLSLLTETLSSLTAIDINECTRNLHSCGLNSNCTNNQGSYSCSCLSGYSGDGKQCNDIDECTTNLHSCDVNSNCINTNGSYICTCRGGFTGNGRSCIDVNECNFNPNVCSVNAYCTNLPGAYDCTCGNGYSGDGSHYCIDINECLNVSNFCDPKARCRNTNGSYICTCNNGYTGSGRECNDLDECTTGLSDCHENAFCNNTAGSFVCICKEGFGKNQQSCLDIDECISKTDNCHQNAKCINTVGGFVCTCNSGFTGNGTHCLDINECSTTFKRCNAHATCNNTIGNFSCTCNEGYVGNGISCKDYDECYNENHNCHSNANCNNVNGSFECICKQGFLGNGTTCTDINECSDGTNTCHEMAECQNLIGNFTCSCKQGFSGNGTTCDDINECDSDIEECHVFGDCKNTYGSYNCSCFKGFNGDGKDCSDIDECQTENHHCVNNSSCKNTVGSFLCANPKNLAAKSFSSPGSTSHSSYLLPILVIVVVLSLVLLVIAFVYYRRKRKFALPSSNNVFNVEFVNNVDFSKKL